MLRFIGRKKRGNLAALIDETDRFDPGKRIAYGRKAKQRVRDAYNWAVYM